MEVEGDLKKFLKIFFITLGVMFLTYLIGLIFTREYDLIYINFIVGICILTVIGIQVYAASIIYSLFLVRNHAALNEDICISSEDVNNYLSISDIDNLVKPMSPVEFLEFLNKDRYGNDNPDKEAILNLLNMIQGKEGYEEKEKFIYMKLASLN